MRKRGLLIPFIALMLLFPALPGAALARERQSARFIFASDTAESFIRAFFSDSDASGLAGITAFDGSREEFVITVEEYRNVFLDKGPKSKRYVKIKTVKSIEPEQDRAYCYLTVKLTPPVFSSRPRSIYALRTTCVRDEGVWKVAPDTDETSLVPQPFSVLYSKKMQRGDSMRSAENQAGEIISLDAEKMLTVARFVQNLLQKAEIQLAYGDAASASETYRKILAMEPKNASALKGLENCGGAQPNAAPATRGTAVEQAAPAAPGNFITKEDFDRKIDALMGKISESEGKAKDSGEFVTKDEIDRKLETIIRQLNENPPAATTTAAAPVSTQAEDGHKAMVDSIIALGEKLFHENEYRRAIVEFQKAQAIDPGNKRAPLMINLCRKALEME